MRILRSAVLAIIATLALLGSVATTASANGGLTNEAVSPANPGPAVSQPADPELPPDP